MKNDTKIDDNVLDGPAGERIICQFYLEDKCRFGVDCINLHQGEVVSKKKVKKLPSNPVNNDGRKEKKPPMKTAQDVIKRIQWDEDIAQEFMSVGYVDRFLGVVEEPFTSFCWEDIASQDWDTLAIPQHRIQFFKYKTDKVWDKTSRLDIVFGSTGSKTKLQDFMDEVDQRIRDQPAQEHASDSESDSEDDDEMISLRGTNLETTVSRISEEDRSTHFLAIKINCKELASNLRKVQELLISKEEILEGCCMDSSLFHITLGMYNIRNIGGICAAVDMMETIKDEVQDIINQRDTLLEVKNLDNFGHRVVYAEVHPKDPQLFKDLYTFVREKFDSLGEDVKNTNSFEYVPHLTLCKVSRPISRARRSQYIAESFYQSLKNQWFGSQRLDNLQLCIIESSTRFDGFYTTLSEIQL